MVLALLQQQVKAGKAFKLFVNFTILKPCTRLRTNGKFAHISHAAAYRKSSLYQSLSYSRKTPVPIVLNVSSLLAMSWRSSGAVHNKQNSLHDRRCGLLQKDLELHLSHSWQIGDEFALLNQIELIPLAETAP